MEKEGRDVAIAQKSSPHYLVLLYLKLNLLKLYILNYMFSFGLNIIGARHDMVKPQVEDTTD